MTPASAPSRATSAPAPPAHDAWTASTFGLELHGNFAAPGLAGTGVGAPGAPVVRARLMPAGPAAGWDSPLTQRVIRWQLEGTGTILQIDRHPELGYRLFARDQGTHVVSPDGREIASASHGAPPWIWQRYLTGQVLPLAAVLSGAEVLHASAVDIGGRAVAFVATSGTGKSSLALNLVLRGANFLADDVAAIRLFDGRPTVLPGPPTANLQRTEAAMMGAACAELGPVIAADDETLRVALASYGTLPVPLSAIYFLHRESPAAEPEFDELRHASWTTLAGSAFSAFHATARRMRNQLEILGAISEQVRLFDLSIPATMGAAELSSRVEAHVHDVLG